MGIVKHVRINFQENLMELTTEERLKQGLAFHKEGKLKEAERLYRSILKSQPLDPDANHNLGLLVVSVNRADEALPLFKIALEANPKIEQFWLSYMDALIKEMQFDAAKEIFKEAKKGGFSGDKFDALEMHLISTSQIKEPSKLDKNKKAKPQKEYLKNIYLSETEMNNLLQHYHNGSFDDAEKIALSIIKKFPEHQFGWKALGAIFKKTGRASESLDACQKSVQLEPQDAEAHSHLGIVLQELGRLKEAEVSYRQAIILKPDFAEAYNNLGSIFKELDELEEALPILEKAITLKPHYSEAYNNLGMVLKELARFEEAEAIFKQAIILKPDFAEAYNSLGGILSEIGRLDEAEESFRQALVHNPSLALAHYNLSIANYANGDIDKALASIKKANDIDPQSREIRLLLSVMESIKYREESRIGVNEATNTNAFLGLTSNRLVLNRAVEEELITNLYSMNFIEIEKIKKQSILPSGKRDGRFGNGICSPDFNLFGDTSSIIQKLAEDLTIIMMEAVKSDIYIYDSFFNILRSGGGSTPHMHLNQLDKDKRLNLGKKKYSLVYYLSTGDQSCNEPGTLKLHNPAEDILPCEGMIVILPANRKHSAVYNGKTDRVMIGVNFYSL